MPLRLIKKYLMQHLKWKLPHNYFNIKNEPSLNRDGFFIVRFVHLNHEDI